MRPDPACFGRLNLGHTDGAGQSHTGSAKRGNTITFGISIQNDGTRADSLKIKATGTATSTYTVKYPYGTGTSPPKTSRARARRRRSGLVVCTSSRSR